MENSINYSSANELLESFFALVAVVVVVVVVVGSDGGAAFDRTFVGFAAVFATMASDQSHKNLSAGGAK